ncbi:MAG: hypothetical protein IH624_00265 [Phycisphaerae bacterium]|nr:hypothetical protein [Phycisphaerae bacterium]
MNAAGQEVEGVSGGREVLIEIDGGIEEVLSAEPAIRSLQETVGGKFNITVCAGDEGLFRNHPGVREIVNLRSWRGGRRFDMCWRLGRDGAGDGEGPLVDRYARRLGVHVKDRRPRIYLDGFDVLRMQRLAKRRPEQMRIVIGAGTSQEERAWDEGKWLALCEYLAGRWGADLVQVGDRGERFFGYGRDLVGKLTAREAATVVRNSDLLIGVDNGWRHLAGAVGRAAVVLAGSEGKAAMLEREGYCAVGVGAGESAVRDIAIEAVLDSAARLGGREGFAGMERAVCA